MAVYDLIIRNGIVVGEGRQQPADVAVAGEAIAAVGERLDDQARETIDAAGCYVFPGFIDPHVHLSLPVGDMVSSDDFTSGTIAAACGGVTTVIDFTTQARGVPLDVAVAQRRAEADGRVAIDYGLHLTLTDAVPETLAQMARLATQGYASIKLYMTYAGLRVSDDETERILAAARDAGVLTMVHAEDDATVTRLTQDLLQRGQTGPQAHPLARPPAAEGRATERVVALAVAAGAPLYVVHVTCGQALRPIGCSRAAGHRIFGETCPHYLLLSDDEYARPGFEAAKYVMTPPLRPRRNQALLWGALRQGTLDVVATDHCPWLFASQKKRGSARFDLIPGGIAGAETRGMLLFSEGVGRGRITLERFVDVMATNPARLFGLYPRKGTLAVGSDADIVVFDPQPTATIRNAALHQRVDYTLFEGWQVTGLPIVTISRGRVVARDGQFVGDVGHGRFVVRRAA